MEKNMDMDLGSLSAQLKDKNLFKEGEVFIGGTKFLLN